MKSRFLTLVALVIFAISVSIPVQAQDNYVAPAIVYTEADDDRLVGGELGGGQISLGRFITDQFALEGLLGKSSLDGVDELDLTEIGINGRYVFRRDRTISPYIIAGFGMLDVDSRVLSNEQSGFLTYGVGLDWDFNDSPFSMRLETRMRDSNDGPKGFNDHITSLGVAYAFGPTSSPSPVPVTAADSDGDGVRDDIDQCPDTPAGADVDARGCDLDDDNDGVPNSKDECPNTPEGALVDTNGCELTDVIELPGVNFESNSDRLLPGADTELRDAAATLRKNPDLVIEVAGHTDNVGAAAYNQGLSERRAITVRDYLINAGANAENLSAKGYGEAEPVNSNETADGRAGNRRVELRIVE